MKSVIQSFLTRFFSFLRASLASWVGWLFAVIHAAWFFLAVANMAPPNPSFAKLLDTVNGYTSTILFAGRPFHFHYESIYLKLLIVGDMPAALVSIPVGFLLWQFKKLLHLDHYVGSYVGAAVLLITGSVQWLLIGRMIQLKIQAKRAHP